MAHRKTSRKQMRLRKQSRRRVFSNLKHRRQFTSIRVSLGARKCPKGFKRTKTGSSRCKPRTDAVVAVSRTPMKKAKLQTAYF